MSKKYFGLVGTLMNDQYQNTTQTQEVKYCYKKSIVGGLAKLFNVTTVQREIVYSCRTCTLCHTCINATKKILNR
jgi:hypothetical protein